MEKYEGRGIMKKLGSLYLEGNSTYIKNNEKVKYIATSLFVAS